MGNYYSILKTVQPSSSKKRNTMCPFKLIPIIFGVIISIFYTIWIEEIYSRLLGTKTIPKTIVKRKNSSDVLKEMNKEKNAPSKCPFAKMLSKGNPNKIFSE